MSKSYVPYPSQLVLEIKLFWRRLIVRGSERRWNYAWCLDQLVQGLARLSLSTLPVTSHQPSMAATTLKHGTGTAESTLVTCIYYCCLRPASGMPLSEICLGRANISQGDSGVIHNRNRSNINRNPQCCRDYVIFGTGHVTWLGNDFVTSSRISLLTRRGALPKMPVTISGRRAQLVQHFT